MKIAFHSSYLGFRGTEVALMDYAWGNREILKNESFFLLPWREEAGRHPVLATMQAVAPVRLYRSPDEREAILRDEGADFFYCVKNGFNDGVFSRRVPTGIHAIFRESEFHGDVYAYISDWLSRVMAHGCAAVAPWMVRLAEEVGDLRTREGGPAGGRWVAGEGRRAEVGDPWKELAIPKEATVIGRHGGDDSFDIPWVQTAVIETARNRPNIWFLFLNTRPFEGAAGLPNIRFLPATADSVRKRRFLNTCDAMIHGRRRGETLGMACLEFASLGKPVLTFTGSPELAHLDILGSSALPYQNRAELNALLQSPDRWPDAGGWKSRFEDYQPETAMRRFQEVFLQKGDS